MDYKKSLFLPKTDFPMRANLQENEKKRFKDYFNDSYAYKKMKNLRQGCEQFVLHDGPPYANGNLHIGHAFNKILKDMIVKLYYFKGFDISFTPGWDCHGLPIEQQVELKLKEKKKTLPKAVIRRLCKEHAAKFVDIQKNEFKSLGVIADWDNPYLTMDYHFEASIYSTLCKVAKKGLLTERNKPVFWSWAAKTALAEAEVEYEDKEDYSIYVAFELDEDSKKALGVKKAAAVIWTTTPWTLPANVAISLNPDEEYVLTSEGLLFAKKLLGAAVENELTTGEVVKEFLAKDLAGLEAINPLNDRKSVLLLGDHVSMDGGSGLVHTAPGHGVDDYFVCLKHNLPVLMSVDDEGLFDESLKANKMLREDVVDGFIGLHIFKANEPILKLLGDALLKSSKFVHSYPFCWRTHKPVIYRATKQFFISLDEPKLKGLSLRQVALKEISKIDFYPKSAIKRLSAMIENRPDWCISRQRDWGVPIAFFRDKKSKELILDDDVLAHIENKFKELGATAWWELDNKDLLPQNSKYDPNDLEKVYDILDVWFDSGSTFEAVLPMYAQTSRANVYLEGSDQHRGWFQSSLLLSCIINEQSPFKQLITHGFSVDARGHKMSKSKGNVISPEEIAKKYGFEVFRLCICLSDYGSDLKLSDEILKQVSEQYKKLRNTLRFLLANTNEHKWEQNPKYSLLDRWILTRCKEVFDLFDMHNQNYDFAKAFGVLLGFLSTELSGIYLDVCKDSLYCDAKDSSKRIASVQAMALILKKLLSSLAPFLTYTVDEALSFANKQIINAKDVFELKDDKFDFNDTFSNPYLFKVREAFYNQIDKLKKEKELKSTLELILECDDLELKNANLADFFGVSELGLISKEEALASFKCGDFGFKIVKSKLYKCPRCWKHLCAEENGLCKRCKKVMDV